MRDLCLPEKTAPLLKENQPLGLTLFPLDCSSFRKTYLSESLLPVWVALRGLWAELGHIPVPGLGLHGQTPTLWAHGWLQGEIMCTGKCF